MCIRDSLVTHQVSRAHVGIRTSDRKLNPLVLADRPVEHHAFVGVAPRAIDEPIAVANALGGNQDALGVHAVEDVLEALPLLANQVLSRNLEVFEEHLVGLMVHHIANRADRCLLYTSDAADERSSV